MYVRKMQTGDNESELIINALRDAFKDSLDEICFAYKPKQKEPIFIVTNNKSVADILADLET